MAIEDNERVVKCWGEVLDALEKYDCRMIQVFMVDNDFGQSVYANVAIVPVEDVFATTTEKIHRAPTSLKIYG